MMSIPVRRWKPPKGPEERGPVRLLNKPRGTIQVEKKHGPDSTLRILVEAVETRQVYGRREYLVQPVAGSGERWVQSKVVDWDEEPRLSKSVISK